MKAAPYTGMAVGLWYVVAPFVWGYPTAFLWWQDILVGALILAVSFSFTLGAGRLHGWLLIFIGYYSMFAPMLHGYYDLSFPLWNDLVFGVLTVTVGMAMGAAGLARAERRATPVPPYAP